MASGKVIQITGPVIDVEFPVGELPAIYNALEITRPSNGSGGDGTGESEKLIVEVQQHLGNNWVRTVAMSTTDGLPRGIEARDTGAPITVPVGEVTLGRVFDVLGCFQPFGLEVLPKFGALLFGAEISGKLWDRYIPRRWPRETRQWIGRRLTVLGRLLLRLLWCAN